MNYFIIDTHGDHENNRFNEADFEFYVWDQAQYNKVEEGDRFIYRRPANSSENGKFYFFGAAEFGEISSVSNGDDRMVRSRIVHGETFAEPLYQDDERLQNYVWKFKENEKNSFVSNGNSWMNFFNQYGMTKINQEDYVSLLGFITENSFIPDEEVKEASLGEPSEIVNIDLPNRADRSTQSGGRHIDYEKKYSESKKTGNTCEELVFKKELEIVEGDDILKEHLDSVKHVSKEEGDGHGYDIVSFRNIDGQAREIFIEVKGTKSAVDTPFYMSKNERLVLEENSDKYYIYRVSIKNLSEPEYLVLGPEDLNNLVFEPKDYIVGIDLENHGS